MSKSYDSSIPIDGNAVPDTRYWGLDPLYNTPVKLFAVHINSLQQYKHFDKSFILFGLHPIQKVEVVGVVVSAKKYPNKHSYLIDDGSGIVQCTVWTNDAFLEDGVPAGAQSTIQGKKGFKIAQALMEALGPNGVLSVGDVVRIKGKLSKYRGIEIHVSHVCIEKDPIVEALHWLQVIQLCKEVYSKPLQLQLSENDIYLPVYASARMS
jgi:hypothetical protein